MEDRFWNKVDKSSSCWSWKAYVNRGGYGVFTINRHKILAHRVAFELVRGHISEGLVIDHLCRNRACVNPSHMEPVTQKTNVLRGGGIAAQFAKRTSCVNGHRWSKDNLYKTTGKRTGRTCGACGRESSRKYALKKRVNYA